MCFNIIKINCPFYSKVHLTVWASNEKSTQKTHLTVFWQQAFLLKFVYIWHNKIHVVIWLLLILLSGHIQSPQHRAMVSIILRLIWPNTKKKLSCNALFINLLIRELMSSITFRYEVFTGRCLLVVLVHNFHVFQNTIDGKFKKLYSKRSGNWRAEAVKEDKTYSYWPALIAEILCKRAKDWETAARHVTVSPSNPQHLAPTIAMRESPATGDLVAARLSRFKQQTSQKYA